MDTFEIHRLHTGKIEVNSTIPVNDRETLSNIYTPNVGKICMAIKDNPELIKEYTMAGKMVAVISDGTAVLGFGNIGPKAALPVMEGKCVIFKEFAGLNAFPLCLDEKDPEEIIKTVKRLALNFAAINLEDFAAPNCFEIEDRLSNELDIPIIHDDQHGTAVVTLAALMGALKVTGKKDVRVVISGAGAAGTAISKLLMGAKEKGVISMKELQVYDSKGLLSSDREDLNKYKVELAELTGQKKSMQIADGIKGADVFIGVSVAGAVKPEMVKSMAKDPIIFAMANPVPEIMPDEAKAAGAVIVATGRSDYPNQINNALAYPGVFKGLLESGAKKMTMEYKILASKAIFEYNSPKLSADNILPSILDKEVPKIIAKTIVAAVK
jgi:malate dehydrogenase (oxaloacetate-decarboxylating)